jgi:cell division septation protein DedD
MADATEEKERLVKPLRADTAEGKKSLVKPPFAIKPVKKAPSEQALAEQAQQEKSSVDMAALFSGPFFGKAGMFDLKKSEVREGSQKYPYTIQLGSFRKLVQAKNAVAQYREKGFSAYWSQVNLKGDEKWFRVYTGLFETRAQAKKYREEQHLLKSLVKKTPNNAFVGTHTDKHVPEANKILLKKPNLLNPKGAAEGSEPSVPKLLNPTPINLKKEGPQNKIKLDTPNSKASGNHEPDAEGSIKKSTPLKPVTPEGTTPAEQSPAKQTPPKNPLPASKPEKKAPAMKTPTEDAPSEQALAEHDQLEKPSAEMTSLFSGPFFGMASISDLKRSGILEESPNYPYSIQLDSFRTLDRAKKAVASYRKKGLSAYWSQVGREGNQMWFRIYTGYFETREQAKKYRKEQNLLKSLVKKTPQNTFFNTSESQQMPEEKTLSKMPNLISPEDSALDDKSSLPESQKSDPIGLLSDGEQEKIRFDRLKSNAFGSNPTGNHAPDVEPSMPKSMGKVTVKIPPRTVTPEKKTHAVKTPEEAPKSKTLAEQTPADMASLFSGPFFGMASSLDLKTPDSLGEYPKYPYSIQLGSFRTLDRAKKAVESYRKKGLHAYWSEADREGNERWFRVYSGSFESREKARRYRKEQSLERSLVKKTPYSAFVGTYSDRQVLEDQTLLLKSLDYVPYTIEEQDGRYRLFVGAFLSKKVAEEKQLDLESRGIQCQVVKR